MVILPSWVFLGSPYLNQCHQLPHSLSSLQTYLAKDTVGSLCHALSFSLSLLHRHRLKLSENVPQA